MLLDTAREEGRGRDGDFDFAGEAPRAAGVDFAGEAARARAGDFAARRGEAAAAFFGGIERGVLPAWSRERSGMERADTRECSQKTRPVSK